MLVKHNALLGAICQVCVKEDFNWIAREINMAKPDKIKKTGKLPRRKVSIDELLELDDINAVIAYLVDRKASIESICCVIKTDGDLQVKATSMPLFDAVAMLEMAKALLIQKEWFEGEE